MANKKSPKVKSVFPKKLLSKRAEEELLAIRKTEEQEAKRQKERLDEFAQGLSAIAEGMQTGAKDKRATANEFVQILADFFKTSRNARAFTSWWMVDFIKNLRIISQGSHNTRADAIRLLAEIAHDATSAIWEYPRPDAIRQVAWFKASFPVMYSLNPRRKAGPMEAEKFLKAIECNELSKFRKDTMTRFDEKEDFVVLAKEFLEMVILPVPFCKAHAEDYADEVICLFSKHHFDREKSLLAIAGARQLSRTKQGELRQSLIMMLWRTVIKLAPLHPTKLIRSETPDYRED